MTTSPEPAAARWSRAHIGAVAAATVVLVVGWYQFWFLCDDAYIAFRYIAQAHLGHGYVWNPPPFRPVEGYSSWLWVALLDVVWRVTGAAPPTAANPISLACSVASLMLIADLARRATGSFDRWSVPLFALVLLGTVTNRTWLAWTSSGLETSLWTMLLLSWVYVAFTNAARLPTIWAALAALMALTRPDGLLFAAATGAYLAVHAARTRSWHPLIAAMPLLAVPAHIAWRVSFYGYPLPNTYYAKHVAPWPSMGLTYASHFAHEYAYWIWVPLAIAGLARAAWTGPYQLGAPLVAAISIVTHFAYYTLRVGGDHFEFRIYHHVVPLVLLTFPWFAGQLRLSGRSTTAALTVMLALGAVIPWTHWVHTRGAVGHKDVGSFKYPIAEHLPAPLSWYARPWDEAHNTMLSRFVGIRHQGHKTYLNYQRGRFPDLTAGAEVSADGYPVMTHASVGYPGWTMPHVAIIDVLGLNDAIIARNPPKSLDPTRRRMAHDRSPPSGYLECFMPNVRVSANGKVTVRERPVPLTDAGIVACEQQFLNVVSPR